MFNNKKTVKNKKSMNKIFANRKKEMINSENNKKVDDKFYYNLTPSFIANSVIEIIRDENDEKQEKNSDEKGNLTINDKDDLIYYEKSYCENAKLTKRRIEAIIQMFMDEAKVELNEVFIRDTLKIIKRKIYFEMEPLEKVKKNIELNSDKSLEYIPHSNEGIIFGTFDNIIGYEKPKTEVMEDLTFWIKYPDEYTKRGSKRHIGSIFYGISGTGKTVTALAFKNELNKKGFDIEYIYVKTQELASGQVSESSRKISDFFINLRKSKKPVLVLMDEIDFLCKKRNDQALGTERTIEFLRQLGGFDNSKIYIIGTTNKPNTLDDAILRTGRFSRKYLFDVPDLDERKEFVEKFIMNKDLGIEIKTTKDEIVEIIAKKTNYFSGSDFNQILEDCINLIIRKKERKEGNIIAINELYNIINENAPRKNISLEVNKLRRWGKKISKISKIHYNDDK